VAGQPATFSLVIPPVTTNATQGIDWTVAPEDAVPFQKVYLAVNATDTAASINEKLSAGRKYTGTVRRCL